MSYTQQEAKDMNIILKYLIDVGYACEDEELEEKLFHNAVPSYVSYLINMMIKDGNNVIAENYEYSTENVKYIYAKNNAQVFLKCGGYESQSSLDDFDNDLHNPTIDINSKASPINPIAKSWLEVISWVVGIAAGLFAIWEFLL